MYRAQLIDRSLGVLGAIRCIVEEVKDRNFVRLLCTSLIYCLKMNAFVSLTLS